MNRYILSFLLTSFLYVIVGTIIVYTPINKSNSIEESIKDSIIKISMISIKPKVEPIPKVEPEAEPIIEQKIESKPEVKPIIKPKLEVEAIIKPKLKPIHKLKPKPKYKAKHKVKSKLKKAVKNKGTKKRIIKKRKVNHRVSSSKGGTKRLKNTAIKKKFLSHVRARIQKNKKYPRIAIRRGIKGRVRVVFDIQKNGTVSNIRLTGSHMILQKAAKEAIKRSFPIAVPSKLRSSLPLRNITIFIGFKIK